MKNRNKPGSVKIIDRLSAVEAIKRLGEEDLLFLNRLISELALELCEKVNDVLLTPFNKRGRIEW